MSIGTILQVAGALSSVLGKKRPKKSEIEKLSKLESTNYKIDKEKVENFGKYRQQMDAYRDKIVERDAVPYVKGLLNADLAQADSALSYAKVQDVQADIGGAKAKAEPIQDVVAKAKGFNADAVLDVYARQKQHGGVFSSTLGALGTSATRSGVNKYLAQTARHNMKVDAGAAVFGYMGALEKGQGGKSNNPFLASYYDYARSG